MWKKTKPRTYNVLTDETVVLYDPVSLYLIYL